MVEHLATLVEQFPGAANQTRCFAHILNLIAKSILRQFEMPKKVADGDLPDGPDLNNATDALAALAQELEDSVAGIDDDIDGDDEVDEDNEEGLGNERVGMSMEEVAELDKKLVPVRLMLTKVSQKNYLIQN